jgi:HEAT repeat protein
MTALASWLLLSVLIGSSVAGELPAPRAIELFSAAPAPATIDRRHVGLPLRSFNVQVVDRLAAVQRQGGYQAQEADREALLAAMRDAARDPYAQLCAARYLLDLDDPEARQRIGACLAGDDPRLLHNAAAVLRLHVDRDPRQTWGVQQMLRLLDDDRLLGEHEPVGNDASGDAYDDQSAVFDEICWDLGAMRLREATAPLIAVVQRRPQVSGAAIALGLIGDAASGPVLLATLVDERGRLRAGQARALGSLRVDEAVPTLLEHLARRYDDGSRYHERVAIEALGQIGDARAAAPLRRYLDEAGAPYRSEARLALVLITSSTPGPDLVELLRHETQRSAQGKLVAALRQRGDTRAARPLAALVQATGDPWVKAQGIALLGDLAGDEAIDALITLLAQPDQRVSLDGGATELSLHQVIADALQRATGQALGPDPAAWRRWRGR